MITGSFARAVHGVPRATHDIDVVIAPTEAQVVALLQEFPESEYYAETEDALQAFRYGTQFNVIDQNSVWKIDFILRKDRAFSRTEFDRRRRINILGVSVYAATPEDLLIAKLEWSKMGESERQMRDAAGIIQVQGSALDVSYVEHWVAELQLERQWKMARAEAG
jgi:hypothetical protein